MTFELDLKFVFQESEMAREASQWEHEEMEKVVSKSKILCCFGRGETLSYQLLDGSSARNGIKYMLHCSSVTCQRGIRVEL